MLQGPWVDRRGCSLWDYLGQRLWVAGTGSSVLDSGAAQEGLFL